MSNVHVRGAEAQASSPPQSRYKAPRVLVNWRADSLVQIARECASWTWVNGPRGAGFGSFFDKAFGIATNAVLGAAKTRVDLEAHVLATQGPDRAITDHRLRQRGDKFARYGETTPLHGDVFAVLDAALASGCFATTTTAEPVADSSASPAEHAE